ncbi:amidase family protein [Phytohabitans kaempferiae]|uniref:Amidase family protein n=1 Tax=Phytohabitans kaempferiae TaxID=1620943 RepID=A0ABV6M1M6_9ACTN
MTDHARYTRDQLLEFARRRGVAVESGDLDEVIRQIDAALRTFDGLPDLPGDDGRIHAERDAGRHPTPVEDPYNAIIRWCHVPGVAPGPLRGMRIGVKDNIAVAGVPMTEGRRSLAWTPTEDAVVVERLLAAGAVITAKTNLEPSDFGPTLNPLNVGVATGGSSSGSAASVAGALVDAAIGVDQGGSIRLPAAWCGIVGMKPTHGLVPSYGLAYCDHTIDTIGPMTRTVEDNALLLEAIAGNDWRDPQWVRAMPTASRYADMAGLGVESLRIGVIDDATRVGCTRATLQAFERALELLASLGATVERVSIPLWSHAPAIWTAVVTAGVAAMADSFGQGFGHLGRIDVARFARLSAEYRDGVRAVPEVFGGAFTPIVFEAVKALRGGLPFARAQNLRRELTAQVDSALRGFDLLVAPTSPTGPVPLTAPQSDGGSQAQGSVASNICPLNLTGHPALTLPAGAAGDARTTGFQIIGRRFDERGVYRAAFAFENAHCPAEGRTGAQGR